MLFAPLVGTAQLIDARPDVQIVSEMNTETWTAQQATQWAAEALPPRVADQVVRIASLQDGWDSYRGRASTRHAQFALQGVLAMVSLLSRGDLNGLHAAPTPEGGVRVEWKHGPRALDLCIEPDGRVLATRLPDQSDADEGRLVTQIELQDEVSWLFA